MSAPIILSLESNQDIHTGGVVNFSRKGKLQMQSVSEASHPNVDETLSPEQTSKNVHERLFVSPF